MTSLNQILVSVASAGLTNAVYAADEVLGTENIFDWGTGTYATIVGAQMIDKGDVMGAMDLFLFDRTITFGTDNAAPSISDADALFCVGVISFPAPFDMGGVRVAHVDSLLLPVKANAGDGRIFGYGVTRTANAAHAAATNIQYNLHFMLDV